MNNKSLLTRGLTALAAVMTLGLMSAPAFAIPVGWTCDGNCGTSGADGDVTLPPGPPGATGYDWISTDQGLNGVGGIASVGGTNGSLLTSNAFAANAGDNLQFFFNFVTSDGSGFADYAWAALVNTITDEITYLVTARTQPSGSIIPGQGLPAIDATLNPPTVEIIGGAPVWSPLGSSSGTCYAAGCGYTGWVQSDFSILTAGTYVLQFGTINWLDTAYDTGLAISGASIDGVIIEEPTGVPEPGTLALLGIGLLGMGMARRRKVA